MVVEVGTHSAWVQDVITEWGHEVLVANPRLMEGSKRRKRKSDRIDANTLAFAIQTASIPTTKRFKRLRATAPNDGGTIGNVKGPRARGPFHCVPSMYDSLRVKVPLTT